MIPLVQLSEPANLIMGLCIGIITKGLLTGAREIERQLYHLEAHPAWVIMHENRIPGASCTATGSSVGHRVSFPSSCYSSCKLGEGPCECSEVQDLPETYLLSGS